MIKAVRKEKEKDEKKRHQIQRQKDHEGIHSTRAEAARSPHPLGQPRHERARTGAHLHGARTFLSVLSSLPLVMKIWRNATKLS